MLLYSLLYLTGYPLTIEDIKGFRQLGSKTPGTPSTTWRSGIETTTGPLGQGLANAVGMALAEKLLAREFNRPGFKIVDHYTYAFCGDGCLMEGISHEACSLAGTLGLGKLIVFYDDNGISIDGKVAGWFTDDTPERFAAYGWHVRAGRRRPGRRSGRAGAVRAARAETSASLADLLQDHHRLRRARTSRAPRRRTARRSAPRRSPRRARQLGWTYPPFVVPGRDPRRLGSPHARARRSRREWRELLRALRAAFPGAGARVRAAHAGQAAAELAGHRRAQTLAALRQAERAAGDARLLAGGAERVWARRCRSCSAARPISPPRITPCSRAPRTITPHRRDRRLPALRRARVRHDRRS